MFFKQPEVPDPDQISPLVLAYIGDAVFELFVRTRLLGEKINKLHSLHEYTVDCVNARAQANFLHLLENELTPGEKEIVRRGRNTKGQVPKSAGVMDYRYSTGFECLIGYLFLKGENTRLTYLLGILPFRRGTGNKEVD